MNTDEIRRRFLEFFKDRAHDHKPSDTLVPTGDPSLLFTGAGMNQFKDEFYGRGDPDLDRAVTCQKCLRTGDIEQVGHTPSHLTFFEMLGNFSFDDYFKEEAILWGWEFVVEQMGLPEDRLVVSIFEGDDASRQIWTDQVGVPKEKIYEYGEDENFWPPNARTQGPNGPCGPCSEIFYDSGENAGCGRDSCQPECDCGRFVELWNLVFQQYDRKDGGVMDPLPRQNIDTGMGLERMARVIQGVPTNFDIDVFQPLMETVADICDVDLDADQDDLPAVRKIADHARAVFFCIADGVIPSNEERGYVVRRLLRRAVREAALQGAEEPFFCSLLDPVIEGFGDQYPELKEARDHIETVASQEEESFQKTVKRGSELLDQYIADLKGRKASVLRGKEVFDLYQTYGFPVEMTESILSEHGIGIDMQGFVRHMERHQEQSKAGASYDEEVFAGSVVARLREEHEPTEFTGYQTLESDARITGIVRDEELVDSLQEGQEGAIVLDRTPAYAEAGGQVGDIGRIADKSDGTASFEFECVSAEKGFYLHTGRMQDGELNVGDEVLCTVDKDHRRATARNHTATHLLHATLREVLGDHVRQSGSLVEPGRLRFDFSHPTEMSTEEIRQVEQKVNRKILEDEPVGATHMSRTEAREAGALAFFGEKYGDIVRVVSVGDESRELCGGTHCERTGEIGLFRITSESSAAGGVRRIEAITGLNSLERLRDKESLIHDACDILNTQEDTLLDRCRGVLDEIRSLEDDLREQREQAVRSMASGGLMEDSERIGGARVVIAELPGEHAELRSAADVLRESDDAVACLLASVQDEKVAMVAGLSQDLVDRGLDAEELVRDAAQQVGGGGGGRPDLAQAGGQHVDKVDEAFDAARKYLREHLEE